MPLLPLLPLAQIATEYIIFAGALVVSVAAFCVLILVPALGAYGRTWEKATAAVLSLFVLGALMALGIGLGALIVANWPEISNWLP